MLKMRLELLGDFEVISADDGAKGCEMAAVERPDIISKCRSSTAGKPRGG